MTYQLPLSMSVLCVWSIYLDSISGNLYAVERNLKYFTLATDIHSMVLIATTAPQNTTADSVKYVLNQSPSNQWILHFYHMSKCGNRYTPTICPPVMLWYDFNANRAVMQFSSSGSTKTLSNGEYWRLIVNSYAILPQVFCIHNDCLIRFNKPCPVI